MNRTDLILKPLAGLASIAITAGILAVAGHMKTELGPLDDIRTPLAARAVRLAPTEVAVLPTIEVVGIREARTASSANGRTAG